MLAVDDAAKAIEFYKAPFGAVEVGDRIPFEEKIGHAEFGVAGALVMIADEFPKFNRSPKTLGGTAVIILSLFWHHSFLLLLPSFTSARGVSHYSI
jgi:PhnB protein